MKEWPTAPDERIYPILRRYSEGAISAYDAACDIQDLGIPGYDDPSASEVVLWSKMAGFGIPSPTEEGATAEAAEILRRTGYAEEAGGLTDKKKEALDDS